MGKGTIRRQAVMQQRLSAEGGRTIQAAQQSYSLLLLLLAKGSFPHFAQLKDWSLDTERRVQILTVKSLLSLEARSALRASSSFLITFKVTRPVLRF